MKHDGIRWQATVHDGAVPIMIAKPRPLKRTLIKLRRVNRRIARSRTIHGKDRRSNRRARP